MTKRGHRARTGAIAAISAILALAWASPAGAAFHLTKIREVSPGSGANTSYVELQSYADGQNFLGGHTITLYNGTAVSGTFTFPATPIPVVPNGASQSTVLVGDTSAPGSPDFTQAGFAVTPVGGAACFDAIPVDCVSWGTGTTAVLPAPGAGTPAPALSSGMALRRSIQPGCPTLLEATDDTDDSATDFALTAPDPRDNAAPITETACAAAGGGGSTPSYGPTPSSSSPAPPVAKKKCKRHKRSASAARKCRKRK